MDMGNIAGHAIGGVVGGALAGAAIGFFVAKKGHRDLKKHALVGAGVFGALAIASTALGRSIPLVPKTAKLGAGGGHRLAPSPVAAAGAYGPWYAPNYYY